MEPELANSRAEHGNGLVQRFCLSRWSSGRRRRRFAAEEGRQGVGGAGRVISAEEAGDGVVRVRIVVSKRELKLMVAAARSVSFDTNRWRRRGFPEPLQGAEQLLQGLRRRHSQSAARRIGRWSPALRSIPEEN